VSVGLDTSVALRLLTGTPMEQAESARAFVAAEEEPVTLSDLVVAELYFALRHHFAVPHVESVRAILALLADPRVRGPGIAHAVFSEALARGSSKSRPGLIDSLIHADYARDGLEIVTFDRDLARLPGARLLRTAPA